MLPFKLDRPLIVFDIESTGISFRSDRIIELAALKIDTDGSQTEKVWLLNPGIPIPPETTAIHHISDADVAACPTFADKAMEIGLFFGDNTDLAGYNILRFDVLILAEEFSRAGMRFRMDTRRVLDAQKIFHAKEPRDLAAALRFYCNREHVGAHGALADTLATWDVIQGQFRKYADLPQNMDELNKAFNPVDPSNVDRAGRFRWRNGKAVVFFGKKKGTSLQELAESDKEFLKWVVKSDFPPDTRKLCEDALKNIFPKPPEA